MKDDLFTTEPTPEVLQAMGNVVEAAKGVIAAIKPEPERAYGPRKTPLEKWCEGGKREIMALAALSETVAKLDALTRTEG